MRTENELNEGREVIDLQSTRTCVHDIQSQGERLPKNLTS